MLQIQNISKSYGHGNAKRLILENLDLTVQEGEFVSILGFSGSGKTTLMNMLAGLVVPDSGQILFEGKPLTGPHPDVSIIFQNYALLPWLTVFDNVLLAVSEKFKTMPKKEKMAHVEHYVRMVNLWPAKDRRPAELSGGMRQRVSVARAFALKPRLLLLDEPLSALDALTRGSLQKELARMYEEERCTMILITNDVDEGILLSDRLIALNPGVGSSFGPCYPITMPRPRTMSSLNAHPHYPEIRNGITRHLLSFRPKVHNA